MPSITVVIPAWNRADIVGRAIARVASQDLPADDLSIEVLVVVDGSTDDRGDALRRLGAQVRCIRHKSNAGAAAHNTGIRAAKCDYLAFLDSDDVWLPNKVARQIAFLRTGGHAISCTAGARRFIKDVPGGAR